MILEKNNTKEVKVVMVFNGKPTRKWLSREDTSSPTASLEDFLRQTSMSMRDKISWFWMLPSHSFRPTCHQRSMVNKWKSLR